MVVNKTGKNMYLNMKFPYCLKPLFCRIHDSNKKDMNKKMIYIKCNRCGGFVEIWADEKTGHCLDCGKTFY